MLTRENFVRKPEWSFTDGADGFSAEFAVIPGKALYSGFNGFALTKHVDRIEEILDSVMRSGFLTAEGFVRIADYTHSRGGGSWQARYRYAQVLNEAYERHGIHPSVNYICGASGVLRAMLLFASHVIRQELVFVDSVEEALRLMDEGWKGQAEDPSDVFPVTRGELSDFIRELGSVSLQLPSPGKTPAADHPLHQLYQAVNVLRSDMMHQTAELTSRYYELMNTRQALERKSGELEILADNMDTQVWYVEKPGFYGAVNLAHAGFLGVERPQISHHAQADVLSPGQLQEWTRDDTEIFELGEQRRRDVWIPDFTGETRLLRITKTPKLSESDTVEYVVCSATDVTEEHRNLLKLKDALRAAEEASRAKRDFLANMSHEIRTPLNGIIGLIDILMEMPRLDGQAGYLSMLEKEASALRGLINDTLDFSKIEAGRMEIESAPFELRRLVEDVAQSMALRAAVAGVEVISHVDTNLPARVVGDPTRLRQVLVNLMGNAIKFTPRGYVSVRAMPDSENSEMVFFEVADTGVGIPENRQSAVFESFAQADTSTTRKYGGTGLGGAISKELVGLMGGSIKLTSEMGKGTAVSFSIPLAPIVEDEVEATPEWLAGKRVLAAGPHAPARDALWDYLGSLGAEAVLAATIGEADEALSGGIDAALVDADFDPDPAGFMRRLCESGVKAALLKCPGGAKDADAVSTASFTLSMPVRLSDLLAALAALFGHEIATPAENAGGKELPKLEGVVLLADDYPTNRQVASHALKRLGLAVEEAVNGLEAVEACKLKDFDAILMDIHMPGMDGLEASTQIRVIEGERGTRRTPIIALSAVAVEDQVRQALESGMDDFLTKPFRPWELAEKLSRWMGVECSVHKDVRVEVRGPVMEGASPPPLDFAAFVESIGDGDAAREILEEFIADAPRQLGLLQEAAANADLAQTASHAHRLKGGTGNLCAEPSRLAAADLEKAARQGDAENVPLLAATLDKEVRRLIDSWNEIKAGGGKGGERS